MQEKYQSKQISLDEVEECPIDEELSSSTINHHEQNKNPYATTSTQQKTPTSAMKHQIHSFSAKLLTTTSEHQRNGSPSKRVNIVDFHTSSSKQMNPSNNTLSSVYVNPYNQDSNTI